MSNGPTTFICLPLTSQCSSTAPTADQGGCIKNAGKDGNTYTYVYYLDTVSTSNTANNFGPGKPNTHGWIYTCPLEGASMLIPGVTTLLSIYMAI